MNKIEIARPRNSTTPYNVHHIRRRQASLFNLSPTPTDPISSPRLNSVHKSVPLHFRRPCIRFVPVAPVVAIALRRTSRHRRRYRIRATQIPYASENMSEITCHAKGAHWLAPNLRTVIDIGGQDCKVIAEHNLIGQPVSELPADSTGLSAVRDVIENYILV